MIDTMKPILAGPGFSGFFFLASEPKIRPTMAKTVPVGPPRIDKIPRINEAIPILFSPLVIFSKL
jgi:hypothetical protein